MQLFAMLRYWSLYVFVPSSDEQCQPDTVHVLTPWLDMVAGVSRMCLEQC